MAAENENSRRLAIVKIPLKLAASLIFDEKKRARISARIFYRGNFVEFEKCEIVDFLLVHSPDENFGQILHLKFCSPEFDEVPDGGKPPICEVEIGEFQFSFDEIFIPENLKSANSEIENSAAENIRQQKLEMEIESAVENVLKPRISQIGKRLTIDSAKNYARVLKEQKQNAGNWQNDLEFIKRNFHPEIAAAIINFAENSSDDKPAAENPPIKIDPRFREEFTEAEVDEAVERILKKAESWSDEPEFFKREN